MKILNAKPIVKILLITSSHFEIVGVVINFHRFSKYIVGDNVILHILMLT